MSSLAADLLLLQTIDFISVVWQTSRAKIQ